MPSRPAPVLGPGSRPAGGSVALPPAEKSVLIVQPRILAHHRACARHAVGDERQPRDDGEIENERADGLRRISELTIALQRAEDKLIAHAETERRRQLELEKTEVRPTRRIKASMTGTHRKRRILAK